LQVLGLFFKLKFENKTCKPLFLFLRVGPSLFVGPRPAHQGTPISPSSSLILHLSPFQKPVSLPQTLLTLEKSFAKAQRNTHIFKLTKSTPTPSKWFSWFLVSLSLYTFWGTSVWLGFNHLLSFCPCFPCFSTT